MKQPQRLLQWAHAGMLEIDWTLRKLTPLAELSLESLPAGYELGPLVVNSSEECLREIGQDLFVVSKDVWLSPDGSVRADILALDRKGRAVLVIVQHGGSQPALVRAIASAGVLESWTPGDFVRLMPTERVAPLESFLTVEFDKINSQLLAILVADQYDKETLLAINFLHARLGLEVLCFRVSVLQGLRGGREYLALARILPPAQPKREYSMDREGAEVETVNLSQLVRELYPLLGCLISAEVVFEHDLIEDIPNVAADVIALQQALLQVTSNASEAQQAPGTIKVATGQMETTSDYLLQCSIGKDLPPGSYVYVEVSDKGRGLNEETRERMFDSFFSTRFAARGLGLTLVSDVLRRHRGGVRIEDGPDGGTTCRILFPSTGWRTPTVRGEKLSTTRLVADRIQREHASHPAELITLWAVDEDQAEVIKAQLSPAQVQQVLLLWQRGPVDDQ